MKMMGTFQIWTILFHLIWEEEDEWKNCRVDDPELESDETREEGVKKKQLERT